jgi:hypothetical protein
MYFKTSAGRHGLVGDDVLQVAAGNQLADDEREALVLAEVIYLEDIGVVQPRDRLGLLGEPLRERGVLCVKGGQHLDSHVPVEVGIVASEHGGHAAAPELLDDPVTAKTTAGWNRDH